jgi:transcriptional regulator with XRE-family HTH domain
MEMFVNAQLIRNERLKRAWSQEHLAQVTGLGLRTVQRIESGGNASLETVKALAAVLELSVETLLADAPAPLVTPPPAPRFSLFKPWRAFVAGCIATLITMGSIFIMQGATAEQIAMDFAVTLNAEQVSKGRMTSEDGVEAVVQIDNLLRISLTPSITTEGEILINADVYLFHDGEYKLFAKPALLTMDGQPAKIKIGKSPNQGFEFDVTSTIE